MSNFRVLSCFSDYFVCFPLFDISLDLSTVKPLLDVFIVDVFEYVLFAVCVLCESFYFSCVVFSSVILGIGS